ncbi:TraB family protein [Nitrospina gracilis 3/211]|uniref:TraB family protein n=1 Tax=Nitrospina gracilis (strain 3/211) TaxID=1266370 RepID=M1Z3S1_NITG3|nr:TraB/GumN family protein [Nitrospina gracilis]MCF8722009.1 pheromone shutdown-related protein TraB [Nitrospina sp. Nb-3]CCQ92134.1 TraB family protein [Nitrospina gracilis 3/211]
MEAASNADVIKTLQHNGTTITLLGTAHVSQKSVELVEEKIRTGDYDCVAVELCPPRYENMVNQSWWKNLDIYQILKSGKGSLLLINLALSAYQRRLADKLGIEPGKEMARAIDLATEHNLRLEVIDRDITTTLQRMYRRVGFWQKLKLVGGMIASIFVGEEVTEEQIENLKEGDMLQSLVEEFGEELPEIKEVLIDERDQYMVGKLVKLAETPDAPKNILALVGAGHLIGMVPAFESPPDSEMVESLDRKPPPGRVGYYVGWGIGLFIISMFAVGYMRSPELGIDLILTWVVLNGSLSALGAALAFAHPLSILTAFVAAPITSLNPTIGAGMVVGIVESFIRKPRVADFESMRSDIAKWSMWWKNRVVRVFLIFFFANLGSAAGTFLAGTSIVHQLVR